MGDPIANAALACGVPVPKPTICECCGAPLVDGDCIPCATAEREGREFAERTSLDDRMKEHERLWTEAASKSDVGA